MKRFIVVFSVLLCFPLFSQEAKPIASQISNYHNEGVVFQQYSLFSKNDSPKKTAFYQKMATDATVLVLDNNVLKSLYVERPQILEISFPYKNSQITVELFKKSTLAAGFVATDEEGNEIDYEPGVYYRGIVENDPTSIVAFSFFEDHLVGVASALGIGNIVVGKAKDSSDYLSYTDNTLTAPNPFSCGVDELPEKMEQRQAANKSQQGMLPASCVRVYYEIAYQPYLDNNQDIIATVDWMTAVHNNISTLYANDNISISMSSTTVWTSPDPYVYSFSQNLSLFSTYRTSFYGDLAHLVNSPSTTSVAYLNSLCNGNNYAYSGISHYYQAVPAYSWTIGAMTHEMGHSLGSPHTHACFWNGDNTAIDGCGPSAGFDEGCSGPIPTNGGTIMSYCHLVSTGINFAKGFGTQVATHIQNTINSKSCLGTDCSCVATIIDLDVNNITTNSFLVSIADNTSTSWDYRIYQYGSSPGTWSSTTSSLFSITGLSPNTYYILEAGNICSSGARASNIHLLLLTDGNYCNGDKFVDSGGLNGPYGDNQHLIKTFYPQVANDKVLLTFTQFDLEFDYDFMSVYDGADTSAPAFANGMDLTGNNIPGPFQATSASGAITIRFDSDNVYANFGWEANLTCQLGVNAFSALPTISVYPNPSNSTVNIEANSEIRSLKMYDMTGRLVKNRDKINSLRTELSVENLSNGMYFLRVSTEEGSRVMQIIKK